MKYRNTFSIRHAILLAVVIGPTVWGANVPVSVVNYAFDPASVTINVNDTIVWTWYGDCHSSTSEAFPALWDSSVFNTGYVFSRTFTTNGAFPYFCVVHGFTGEIDVSTNNPRSVILTSPPAGVTFSTPATINLAANVSDSVGTVVSVGFFEGPTLLKTLTSSPYSFVVTNPTPGSYTFSAVATDNGGLSVTNSVSIQVVTPTGLTIAAPHWNTPASFQFNYAADVNLRYEVQRSLALSNWVTISTNTATSTSMPFLDTSASAQAGFYRVERLSNP